MLRIFRSMLYFVCCKILYRVEYINLDKDKKEIKGHLLCANHNDWLDAVILWVMANDVKVMAKAELFKVPIWSWFIKKLGAFPIRRGEKDFGSIYHAVKIVQAGSNLIIFPEGTRKAKLKNIKPKKGPVYIAIASGGKIQPVYIEGNKKMFRKVKVVYGDSYDLIKYKEQIKDKELLNKLTKELMKKIYDLGNV
ncbi:MAG: lysophospholipid acyltransferase family protein [Clostridia bacterium]|nr:lysophospholipid acyltransferase family protein [Clostridia bacterium]MDD4375410.1 lysophospholipid acyltransferase family protein [Clostridia bacterium]